MRQPRRVLARKDLGAQPGAHDARIDEIGAHLGSRNFAGIDPHQGFEAGLGDRVGAVIGEGVARQAARDKDRAARGRGAQQRVHRPDEPPIGRQVEPDDLAPQRRVDMAGRRKDAEFGGIADEDVEPSVALIERRRELVDPIELAQVEGHQRGAATGGADRVVDLLETPDRARREHDMRALAGKALGDGSADPARGARDERDPAGEPAIHQAFSVKSESCTETLPASASAGRIG